MLQYRQVGPSHVDHEWRRLHSEARAPLPLVACTLTLHYSSTTFPFR